MPRYDFNCADCSTRYEVRLSMSAYSDGEGRECPECGSGETERAFTAVNVIAGGGGYSAAAASANACGPSGFT